MRAWLCLMLVACGDGKTTAQIDAPVAVDADLTDAPDATVTIDHVAPPAGTRAIFLAPDDDLLADLDLASGQASASMPAGGTVNVFVPGSSADTATITTFFGVRAGDHLRAGFAPSTPQVVTVSVPVLAGATSYEVSSPCGSNGANGSTTVAVTLFNCGTQTDFHVRAYSGTTTHGTFLVKNIAIASTISVTGTYVPPRTATVELTNMASAYKTVSITMSLGPHIRPQLTFNGSATTTVQATGELPDVGLTEMSVFWQIADPQHTYQSAMVSGTTDFAESFDTSAYTVPWNGGVTFDGANSRVSWTESGATTADAISVYLDTRATLATGTFFSNHRLVAPHGQTMLRVPKLPAAYANFNLSVASAPIVKQVTLVRSSDPVAARTMPFTSIPPKPGWVSWSPGPM